MTQLELQQLLGEEIKKIYGSENMRVDPMTDNQLPECLACPDFVGKAQTDLEVFYRRDGNG